MSVTIRTCFESAVTEAGECAKGGTRPKKYRKVTMDKTIAEAIGIRTMRKKMPAF